jgi:hypothetical protein
MILVFASPPYSDHEIFDKIKVYISKEKIIPFHDEFLLLDYLENQTHSLFPKVIIICNPSSLKKSVEILELTTDLSLKVMTLLDKSDHDWFLAHHDKIDFYLHEPMDDLIWSKIASQLFEDIADNKQENTFNTDEDSDMAMELSLIGPTSENQEFDLSLDLAIDSCEQVESLDLEIESGNDLNLTLDSDLVLDSSSDLNLDLNSDLSLDLSPDLSLDPNIDLDFEHQSEKNQNLTQESILTFENILDDHDSVAALNNDHEVNLDLLVDTVAVKDEDSDYELSDYNGEKNLEVDENFEQKLKEIDSLLDFSSSEVSVPIEDLINEDANKENDLREQYSHPNLREKIKENNMAEIFDLERKEFLERIKIRDLKIQELLRGRDDFQFELNELQKELKILRNEYEEVLKKHTALVSSLKVSLEKYETISPLEKALRHVKKSLEN